MPSPFTSPAPLTPARFATLFRASSRVLWCVAVGVVGDRAQGEDIVQEAALLALGKLDTFRPGSSFPAWMGQYVRYLALNQRRKSHRRQRALDADGSSLIPQPPAPPQDPQALFDRNVARALSSLSESQRTCLLLKTVVELEYGEIAELLEIPSGTAMSHVSRARAKMRSLLEPESDTNPKEALQ
ncbi:MAG: RNA polymerase sigma factor [Nannocystales bacterium]